MFTVCSSKFLRLSVLLCTVVTPLNTAMLQTGKKVELTDMCQLNTQGNQNKAGGTAPEIFGIPSCRISVNGARNTLCSLVSLGRGRMSTVYSVA